MTVSQSEEYRRIQFINALFSWVTKDDLYLAKQVRDAISYSLQELEEKAENGVAGGESAFNAAAVELLKRFFVEERGLGFFHWDAMRMSTSAMPLFARQELMAGLKGISKYKEAILLVTNLKQAFFPKGKPETEKRRREYRSALEYVRALVESRTSPKAKLRLLFL